MLMLVMVRGLVAMLVLIALTAGHNYCEVVLWFLHLMGGFFILAKWA